MTNAKRAVAVVWRTVVCAAIVPACRHDAASSSRPEPVVHDEQVEQDDPADGEEVDPGCGDLDVSTELERDPGDQEDGVIHLRILSEPPGALVEINDEDTPRGVTPIDIELAVKSYTRLYSLSLASYDIAGGTLHQGDDRDLAIRFDLVDEGTSAARPRCHDDDDELEHYDIGFVVA